MPDKKKSIDEIFEEEFFDLPSKKPKKTEQKKKVDEVFDDFAPQPVDEIKRKKKVAEELLEDFLAPPKKEPPPKKKPPAVTPERPKKVPPQKPEFEEKKAVDELIEDFIIPPPSEEVESPPQPSVEKPESAPKVSPPPEPSVVPPPKPSVSPPPPRKEVKEEKVILKQEVKGRGFLTPFLIGFVSGIIVAGGVSALLYLGTGKKGEVGKVARKSSATQVKKEAPPTPPKVATTPPPTPTSTTPPSPSPPPSSQPSATPPPPPPVRFILTVSNIEGDSALSRVRRTLSRYGVKESSVSKRIVSRESYEVYIDKVFKQAEANAADLKLGLMGFKYTKKNEGGGVKFYFGPYSSAVEASKVMQRLTQINYPAKIRVLRNPQKYYTLKTVPVSEATANKVKRALRGYKVSLEKAS